MTVANGEFANEDTFNNAFVSLDEDSAMAGILTLMSSLKLFEATDSTTNGATALLADHNTSVVRVTHAGLTGIGTIDLPTRGLIRIIVNDTGAKVTLINDASGTAAKRILTGTNDDLDIPNEGMAFAWYDIVKLRWRILGGSGSGGGGGISPWVTATAYTVNTVVHTGEKIYRCAIAHTSGTFATDLAAGDWVELAQTPLEIQSTGITAGGGLAIGTPNTTLTVALGSAVFTDNTSGSPKVTHVSWSAKNNQTLTFLTSALATFVGIDITGALVQQTTPFTNTQTRMIAPLGAAIHSNLTIVNAVNDQQACALSPYNQFRDMAEALGIFNVGEGNIFSANGANLNIDKTAGAIHKAGSNFIIDPLNPNVKALGALTALSFRYRRQNGGETADVTAIDPNTYDVGGVATTVPNGRYSIQRINVFTSNLVRIQPGQDTYSNLANAINGIATEVFTTEANIKANGLLRGYLIIKKNTTDLTNASDVLFVEAGKFGAGGGGAGASSVSKFCPPTFPQWYYGMSAPPYTTFTDGFHFDEFDNVSNQEMFALLTVPDEYIPGSPIVLKGLQFITTSTTGNVLFRTQATLIQSNTILAGGSYTDQRTSTNTQVAVAGVANTSTPVGSIDVSSLVGVIGATVQPGYKILIRFYRDNINETSGAANDARLVRDGIVTWS